MLRRIFIIVLIFSLSSQIKAQWSLIHQDSTQQMVSDLFFLNKDTGFVSGANEHGNGFILRTNDGGITWSGTSSQIAICNSIIFLNDSVGLAGGQDGVIYKTVDGGVIWSFFSDDFGNYDFNSMFFANDTVGFIRGYGGGILRTINAGLNWDFLIDVKPNSEWYNYEYRTSPFSFINDSVGFVAGYGVYKTSDQGNTWISNTDTVNQYFAIHMFNENEGFAVGDDGVIIQTYNSWSTWTKDSLCQEDLKDIDFINDSVGYITGGGFGYETSNWEQNGFVMYTTNKGNSWNRIDLSQSRLNTFQYIDSVAYTVGSYGEIFKNENYSNLLSISIAKSNSKLKIWPNPAKSYINIELENSISSNATVFIYDLGGTKVLEQKRTANGIIPLNDFYPGTYVVKIVTDQYVSTQKIILIN